MKKRILALILAMSMIFALVGCSSSSSDTTSDNSPATDSQPADDTQSGGDTSTDTTATKTGTLKIGLMVHQTGWFAGVDTPNYNEFPAMVD
jgi:PBP1b-binding outer membrane lipoprotein LpoB